MIRPAALLDAYHQTGGSATRAALLLGCSRRWVYTGLRRAGIPARPYRRLRLVTASDPFREFQAARMRAIDRELRRLRADWAELLDRAAQPNGKGHA